MNAHAEIISGIYRQLCPSGTPDTVMTQYGLKAVYNFVDIPEGAEYPYLVIGDAQQLPYHSFGRRGAELLTTVHFWSKMHETGSMSAIVSRVIDLLEWRPLPMSVCHHVSTIHEQTLWLRDPNPEVTHVAIRFRITIEEE